jgi:hypothetical protein
MAVDTFCASLVLTPSWNKERVLLVCAIDGIRLCQDGQREQESSFRAVEWVERFAPRRMAEVRAFVAQARVSEFSLRDVDDQNLMALLRTRLRTGELVAIREPSFEVEDEHVSSQRRLVREIEAKSRKRLNYGGRLYRLAVGLQLGRLPDRESYEVVRRQDAVAVLSGLAQQGGAAGADLGKLLGEAGAMLTQDWRPPFSPDGLVLLRRVSERRAPTADLGPALTPSQIRKLSKKDWIEIEVVDQDGEPLSWHYQLELADQDVREGELDDDGFVGVYEIESGSCKLVLGEVKVASAAVAKESEEPAEADVPNVGEPEAPEDAPEPEDSSFDFGEVPDLDVEETVPIKLRFKLLDLLGKPVAGATVSIAGTNVIADGDGMVETEVNEGSQNVQATLPSGEVALHVGSLNPQDDSNSDDGFKMRLFNMGFLWDTNVDPSDDEMVIALQDFQAEYKIKLSGQLDDATKAKLVDVYGC